MWKFGRGIQSLYLLLGLCAFSRCGSPAPVLLLTVDNVPQQALRITINVSQGNTSGTAVFQRNSSNQYHYVTAPVMENPAQSPSDASVELAVDLPTTMVGDVYIATGVDSAAMGAMPKETHGGCANATIAAAEVNMATVMLAPVDANMQITGCPGLPP